MYPRFYIRGRGEPRSKTACANGVPSWRLRMGVSLCVRPAATGYFRIANPDEAGKSEESSREDPDPGYCPKFHAARSIQKYPTLTTGGCFKVQDCMPTFQYGSLTVDHHPPGEYRGCLAAVYPFRHVFICGLPNLFLDAHQGNSPL